MVLRRLLASDGWRLYADHLTAKYGAARYRQRMQLAIKASNSVEEVQKVEIGATFAEYFLRWPERRIEDLEKPPKAETLQRGGY